LFVGVDRDELLLNESDILRKVISFCKEPPLFSSTLYYLRNLSAYQQYKHAFIINDITEVILPWLQLSQPRKDILMLLQNISESKFKDGTVNLFQSVMVAQDTLSHICKYCDQGPDELECQFFACLIACNLSMHLSGFEECNRLSLFQRIRHFVENHGRTYVPMIGWNTMQPLVYLIHSPVEEVKLFGIYALRLFGPKHEHLLWKALCLNNSINTLLSLKNSRDKVTSTLATELLQLFDINQQEEETTGTIHASALQLSQDLHKLYHRHKVTSDKMDCLENPNVWIKVGEYYVPVNRDIVSCRSKYFQALLSTTWNRSSYPIVIEDISLEVFSPSCRISLFSSCRYKLG